MDIIIERNLKNHRLLRLNETNDCIGGMGTILMTTSNNNKNNRINEAKVNNVVCVWKKRLGISDYYSIVGRKQSTKKHMNSST